MPPRGGGNSQVDTGLEDTALKLDLSVGLNFTWLLPVYAKQESFFLTD